MAKRYRKQRRFRLPQVSLRTLLLGTFSAGIVAGTCGPAAVHAFRAWLVADPAAAASEWDIEELPPAGGELLGYYESAESPLR